MTTIRLHPDKPSAFVVDISVIDSPRLREIRERLFSGGLTIVSHDGRDGLLLSGYTVEQVMDMAAEYDLTCEPCVMRAAHVEKKRRTAALRTLTQPPVPCATEVSRIAPGLSLEDYQVEGVARMQDIMSWAGGCIQSDDKGLGKTIQILTALPTDAAIVVGTSSIKENWAAECKLWRRDLTPVVLNGRGSFRPPRAGEIVILNYSILPGEETLSKIKPLAPTTLIVDEAHNACCNPQTKRYQRIRLLSDWLDTLDMARDADGPTGNDFLSYRIGATATPLKNRLDDVFNLTEALGLFRAAFVYGGEAIRYASPSYVRDCLHKISVRRMIDDVIDLPPARFVPIRVNSNDTDLMRKLDATHDQLDAYLAALEQGVQGRMPFFSEMSRVKRELAEAKADATIARALEHINDGRQVVVFSDHRAVIDRLAKMAGWTTISGAVPKSAERIRRADAFRDGKYKGISCTIGAAREGINLQSAHVMIFCDLNWVPANNEQAFGRIRRRGQTKECLYELMIIGHPLDRRIAEINIRKEKLSREAITVTTPTARSVGEYVGRLDDAIANANV